MFFDVYREKKTKLIEFVQHTNREEQKTIKSDFTLQWFRCIGFRFSPLPMFTSKVAIFLNHGHYLKILAHRQGLPYQQK